MKGNSCKLATDTFSIFERKTKKTIPQGNIVLGIERNCVLIQEMGGEEDLSQASS
jgi:hypothetical protein